MEKAVAISPATGRSSLNRRLQRSWGALVRRQELIVFLLLLLSGAGLGLGTDTFFTSTNLLNVGIYVSWFAIAAFGVGLAIIVGGIDLSVASVMALAGLVCALALQLGPAAAAGDRAGPGQRRPGGAAQRHAGQPVPPAALYRDVRHHGPGARHHARARRAARPRASCPQAFLQLGQGNLVLGPLALPLPVLWMLLLAALVSLMLHRTLLGRYIYTVGSDEQALLAVGVPTDRLKLLAYLLSGLLAAPERHGDDRQAGRGRADVRQRLRA